MGEAEAFDDEAVIAGKRGDATRHVAIDPERADAVKAGGGDAGDVLLEGRRSGAAEILHGPERLEDEEGLHTAFLSTASFPRKRESRRD